jgi:hypothetical protein
MATEKIFIGIDQDRIELTGKDKEAFIAEREARAQIAALLQAEQEAQKALKISAYTKLGLTEEEINAIL